VAESDPNGVQPGRDLAPVLALLERRHESASDDLPGVVVGQRLLDRLVTGGVDHEDRQLVAGSPVVVAVRWPPMPWNPRTLRLRSSAVARRRAAS